MSVPATDIAEQAAKHLGEDCPTDSCVSNGLERWTHELGLPGLDTDSVTTARAQAKAGHNGWRYVEGLDGLQVGNFVDWDPEVLGAATDRHVSCVVELDRFGRVKSIGSGGPTGKVAYQPRGGGFNPREYFVGYFVAPAAAPAPKPPKTAPVKTVHPSSSTYTVKAGDDLIRIAAAHKTTVPAIMKANPPAADHVTRDYHVTRANLILVGQKLHLP